MGTVTITSAALRIFKRALQAKNKEARKDAERELMAELRLESWEFISLPYQCPGMRYIDDAALPDQLEQVLAQALYRPPGLASGLPGP